MFMQDEKRKEWWYRCEKCGAETERRKNHESPEGFEGWRAEEKGVDVHICPKCQIERRA
jgi:hypothetical protein